jgi:imidazole glycerol phosphate synthase glutamine amidotransferase subunit
VNPVAIVRTGSANLASVCAAMERLGAVPRLIDRGDQVRAAERVVLPGVGAFGAAMRVLDAAGMIEPLRDHARQGKPLLAICLGFQLLAEGSEESPDVAGLGIVPGRVARFACGVRVPQFGWNRVAWEQDAQPHGYAYFANSYRLDAVPPGWTGAMAEHGERFVAAIARPGQLACQFHPELSGAWGEALLRTWWDQC